MQEDKTYVRSITGLIGQLRWFKQLIIILISVNVLLAMGLMYSFLREVTVIMEGKGKVLSFQGQRKEVSITNEEIKKVAENFIKERYEWDTFSIDQKMDQLSIFITSGLKAKLEEDLRKQMDSFKAISQYVGKLELKVNANGEVVASFDKILRITAKGKEGMDSLASLPEKIPLLSETQVQLKIVRGSSTDANPLGLYINSVTEYGSH